MHIVAILIKKSPKNDRETKTKNVWSQLDNQRMEDRRQVALFQTNSLNHQSSYNQYQKINFNFKTQHNYSRLENQSTFIWNLKYTRCTLSTTLYRLVKFFNKKGIEKKIDIGSIQHRCLKSIVFDKVCNKMHSNGSLKLWNFVSDKDHNFALAITASDAYWISKIKTNLNCSSSLKVSIINLFISNFQEKTYP